MAFPIALAALAIWTGCKHSQAQGGEAKTFVLSDTMLASIRIDTAFVKPVENELRLSGKVTPDKSKALRLYPHVNGYVKVIKAQQGDYVKKGQVLALIQSDSVSVVAAPASGYVIGKKISNGMELLPDDDEPVFTISRPKDVWIMASLPVSDTSHMQDGYPVDISVASYPDRIFHGSIDKVFRASDANTMQVRIRPDNEGMPLKPGMLAGVTLRYTDGSEMPAIPSSAVIFDKGKNFVMVFRDKFNIHTREVEVARSLNGTSYISHGLQPDEKIISKNQLQIYDALND